MFSPRFTFHIPRNPKNPLKRLGYILSLLICIGCAGGSSRRQATILMAELRAHLQPLTTIGTYVGFDQKTDMLYMGNALIDRWIYLNKDSQPIQTIRYTYKPSGQNYVDLLSEEFRFRIGKLVFSGDSRLLTYDTYQISQKIGGVKQVTIQFTYTPEEESKPIFHLQVHYEIYPDLPIIHKWLTIQNLTDSAFYLEDIAVESLSFFAARVDRLQIWGCEMSGQPEEAQSPPWEGGTAETFVLVQDPGINGGVVLGNESAGILKYYGVCSDRDTMLIGLTPTTAMNGIEIRVPPKRSMNTPKVWTMLFQGPPQTAVEEVIEDVVAHGSPYSKEPSSQMPAIRWAQLGSEWNMLGKSLRQGDLVVFDYDWNVEELERLKRVSQQVHESRGKAGIRLPVADIRTDVLDRPEWRLTPVPVLQPMSKRRDEEIREQREGGKETQQSTIESRSKIRAANRVIYCVLSDYGYYLSQAVKALLEETEADLLIFDGAILSPTGGLLKGCDAFGHEHYTRAESIGVIYRWIFDFANHLRRKYPDLQLGITATAYGVKYPDAACLAHFDLFFDHLSLDSP